MIWYTLTIRRCKWFHHNPKLLGWRIDRRADDRKALIDFSDGMCHECYVRQRREWGLDTAPVTTVIAT